MQTTYFSDSPSTLEAVLQAAVNTEDPNPAQLYTYFCGPVPYTQDACGNDVVVSAASQIGLVPFEGRPFMNLAHTGIGKRLTALLIAAMATANLAGYAQGHFNFVDNNVLDDPSVEITVACWLAQQGFCSSRVALPTQSASMTNVNMPQYVLGPPAGAPTSRSQAQPTQPPMVPTTSVMHRKPVDADNRVEITVPTSTVSLGTPIELPLSIHQGTLKTVILTQRQRKGSTGSMQPIPDAYDLSPVVGRDGKQFVRVTPARLGQIELEIVLAFTDGGLTTKTVALWVMPSREQPAKFWPNGVGQPLTAKTPVLYKSLQHPVGGKLAPTVIYPDAKAELRIDDNFVQYSVRSNPKSGVIDFDPRRGAYMPTGLGHALITGSYSGMTVRFCIVVGQTDWEGNRKEDCADMEK